MIFLIDYFKCLCVKLCLSFVNHQSSMFIKIYHRIFYDGASSKDHGTLLANMTKLRYNVCYLQYHEYILYNYYSY